MSMNTLEQIPDLSTAVPETPGTVSGVPTMAPVSVGRTRLRDVIAIVGLAIVVLVGLEVILRLTKVPEFIFPTPSAVAIALWTEWPAIWPHYVATLFALFTGYLIGAGIGIVLAAVITQFPFVEKIIAPYILILATTPMLALVPLLILNFGFGPTPRIIAVALAAGPMVMINSAAGFRRVDLGKIALARSFGASTLQTFTKIRVPMALPMVITGLMIGAIFGLLTVVGAEMTGGSFGLGSRLTYYSSVLQTPEFFAVLLILSATGILIYSFFVWLGSRLLAWHD